MVIGFMRWLVAGRRQIAAVLAVLSIAGIGLLAYGIVQVVSTTGQIPAGNQQQLVTGFARLDRPAPAFRLPDLRGHGLVWLVRLAGRPIVINFWSSTCVICKTESPALAEVARRSAGRVSFVGIDTLDQRQAALAFVERYRLPYRSAFDPQEIAGTRYGIPGLPVTYFLSASGRKIVGVNYGALTARSLDRILRMRYRVA